MVMPDTEICVIEDTLPAAWEKALLKCWKVGDIVKTQYDKPNDPPSRDCAALIVVREPLKEPMIHKSFPASYAKLKEYEMEVTHGIHDKWIDPKAGKWNYTYHSRFKTFPVNNGGFMDQRKSALEELAKCGYTRRALQTTWIPQLDAGTKEPPCVQYIVDRVIDGRLNRHVHIRSNDAFKAAFMNGWAFIRDQLLMLNQLTELTGEELSMGRFRWFADSFHIYGSYFGEFKKFLEATENRKWKNRTIRSDDPQVVDSFESAEALVARGELVTT
jgi:thymidylate synthase